MNGLIPATTRLYFQDSYKFIAQATVLAVTESSVILDSTIFHPRGGGQESDSGIISSPSSSFTVTTLADDKTIIVHNGTFSGPMFNIGEQVTCKIDEGIRRLNMRMHSAGHALDVVVKSLKPDYTPSKGSHYVGNCNVEYVGIFDPSEKQELLKAIQEGIDRVVQDDLKVEVGYDEDGKRTVSYGDLKGLCGGTHVKSTGEIGKITIEKISKQKGNVKVKYSIE